MWFQFLGISRFNPNDAEAPPLLEPQPTLPLSNGLSLLLRSEIPSSHWRSLSVALHPTGHPHGQCLPANMPPKSAGPFQPRSPQLVPPAHLPCWKEEHTTHQHGRASSWPRKGHSSRTLQRLSLAPGWLPGSSMDGWPSTPFCPLCTRHQRTNKAAL